MINIPSPKDKYNEPPSELKSEILFLLAMILLVGGLMVFVR